MDWNEERIFGIIKNHLFKTKALSPYQQTQLPIYFKLVSGKVIQAENNEP